MSVRQQGISGLGTNKRIATNERLGTNEPTVTMHRTSLGNTRQCEQFRWRWVCTVLATVAGPNRPPSKTPQLLNY